MLSTVPRQLLPNERRGSIHPTCKIMARLCEIFYALLTFWDEARRIILLRQTLGARIKHRIKTGGISCDVPPASCATKKRRLYAALRFSRKRSMRLIASPMFSIELA